MTHEAPPTLPTPIMDMIFVCVNGGIDPLMVNNVIACPDSREMICMCIKVVYQDGTFWELVWSTLEGESLSITKGGLTTSEVIASVSSMHHEGGLTFVMQGSRNSLEGTRFPAEFQTTFFEVGPTGVNAQRAQELVRIMLEGFKALSYG